MHSQNVKDDIALALVNGAKWKFDERVTACFDDMLQRSIPQYAVMRDAVLEVGGKFVRDNTAIIDLGCSRGEALRMFADRFGAYSTYIGVDVEPSMVAAARAHMQSYIDAQRAHILELDLRNHYPDRVASLTLAVLALQFVPVEFRGNVVRHAYENTVDGGAFVVVEKLIGETAQLQDIFQERYYAMKLANDYTQDEIDNKRASLEHVMVPLPASANEHMLRAAGFRQVECFWRWMNFAAWVAIK